MAGPPDRRPDPAPLTRGRCVCGPARRACGAQDRPGPARAAGGRGDRDASCPTWPRNAGWRRPTAGTSPSSSSRSPTPAPRRCTASSTWPTPSTSNKPSPASPPSSRTSGSDDSLNVRRAAAVGELARHQLALHLTDSRVVEEGAPRPSRNHHPKRQVVLYVHLSRAALEGVGTARLEQGNQLITAGQVRDWCATAGNDHREAGPGPRSPRPRRHRRRTRPPRRDHRRPGQDLRLPLVHQVRETLRHRPHHPRRPAADRPVRAISRRSVDGITGSRPTAAGPTRPSNPATISGPSKHGYSYLRDPDGTLDVSRDRHRAPD